MSTICDACSEPLPPDGKYLTCATCTDGYHVGKNCSNITDAKFAKMSAAKRGAWECQACKTQTEKLGTTASNSGDASSAMLSAVHEKLDALKNTVDALTAKVGELLTVRDVCGKLAESVGEVQKFAEHLSSKYDSVLTSVTANQAQISKLQPQVEAISSSVAGHAAQLDDMNVRINELEQYSRVCNFEIHGYPYKANEDLVSFLGDVASRLQITDFTPDDVNAVHRLPSRDDSVAPILVQMRSVSAKQKWLSAKNGLAALQQNGSFPRLYFKDNLTRMNRNLYRLARARGKERNYKFVWTRNGKVLAKKLEGAPVLRIERLSDLDRIV